jgi:hypothetical protein
VTFSGPATIVGAGGTANVVTSEVLTTVKGPNDNASFPAVSCRALLVVVFGFSIGGAV